jgi:hypothetical protein
MVYGLPIVLLSCFLGVVCSDFARWTSGAAVSSLAHTCMTQGGVASV